MSKIIFFGAGSYAYNIWQYIQNNSQLYIDDYIAFSDNNENLWGNDFCGRKVISPYDIYDYNADLIVITSIYEKTIRKQLIEKLGISPKQIYTYGEYLRKCYADYIYRKKYINYQLKEEKVKIDGKKLIIYTAITGDYDTLKEPLFVENNLTYVCFTNNQKIKSEVWNIEYINNRSMNDVYLSKHIKLNPHIYFSDYEISIWVDGKYQIMDNLRTYLSQYQKQSNMLCFPHPERQCVYDEASACILGNIGVKKDIITQMADYFHDGYPINYGLYEGGCIVRVHHDPVIKRLMEKWENEIKKYSFRDQISLPYICWKNNFTPDICNLDINRNQWLLQRRTLY